MTQLTRRSARAQAEGIRADDGADVRTPARVRPRPGRMVGDALLWLAALAGVICIVLVVLAFTAQITLILFRTGSMSPTIPAGSVAVVQRIPASGIEVGDVVTVDRVGELPVTHRVTTIAPGVGPEERIITMRGDANASEDPFPYTVSSVRIVLFSVPGVATLIVGMGNPVVLGTLTLAATTLVVWAFWPRTHRRADRGGRIGAGGRGG
ncbi:signal peptidase I [Microbacterium aurugineum]|uniref:signal peptidase I n=1 Tax=Microbacterium aurugineum TaxID=2851642 RepID=UPI0020BDA1EE|nr:signal peptidase I [Microbacterium aurugineum]MCK8478615.1 signal peptidase I [Microbacterium aurugineum]